MAFRRGSRLLSTVCKEQHTATPGWGQHGCFSTQAKLIDVKVEDCSSKVRQFHEQFTTRVQEGRTIPLVLIRGIFEQCDGPEDAALAFKVLHKHRIYRSSKHHVIENFNEYISSLAIGASVRTKHYDLGLQVLWKHNFYGFSPSLRAAHLLLNYAREGKNLELMKKTYKTMIDNSLIPTTQTADLMIRTCKAADNLDLMCKLAQDFLENGTSLSSAAFDILISTAANHGCVDEVNKIQSWREGAALDYTIASVFALAKAHVLQGDPHAAVDLISVHCKDISKASGYLSKLVRLWPTLLLSKKDELKQEDSFLKLKEDVRTLVKFLMKKHRSLSVDVDEEFGKGIVKSEEE